LYRRLIEGDYVLNFQGGLMPTIDPYLFTFTCTLHPDRRVEDVLHALEGEMSRLQDSPPPAEEVQRAIKQARALAAYGSESIYGQGSWLGFDFTVNAGRWHTSFLERLSAVTPQDVQHIAQTYLRPEQRIIGVYRPTTR
ncbi:MAG: insulinase family protein, partial [Anaerolineae bacterium]